MIKISVIVPVYNAEKYIKQCLESILIQTMSDIEIICVDDGSTDNSLSIINYYKNMDSRIKVIEQENKGPASARNTGIKVARGKYLIYIDSDDRIKGKALEILYKMLEKYEYDILYFSAKVFADKDASDYVLNEASRLERYYYRNYNILEPILGEKAFISLSVQGCFLVSPCLQIIKKSYLQEKNICFYEGILHEDNLYTLFSLLQAKRVGCVDMKLYERRLRNNSIMTKQKTYENVYGLFLSFDEIEQKYFDIKYQEIDIYKYIELFMKRLLDESIHIYKMISKEDQIIYLSSLNKRQERKFQLYLEMDKLKEDILFLENENESLKNQCAQLESIISNMSNSISYKIGRIVTLTPRYVVKVLKKRVTNKLLNL